MQLDGIRQKVFLDRYSLKDKKGNPLEQSPEEMWQRVAKYVASIESGTKKQDEWEKKFLDSMRDFQYVPGGRILSGAGTGYAVTFYNCFVIPSPADSREGILETLKQMVEIMAHGGGVGINLSSLRPRGARVRKVNGYSSGPCNWSELFSVATKDIIQQGGTRRGALMLMLWDWHPDIEEFITVKQDLSRINGANLSVCVSDSFMEAVEKDEQWPLLFADTKDPDYDEHWRGDMEAWKQRGGKVIVHKLVSARKIWDMISHAAWRSAEPGLVFMERYNKLHNNWYWNRINCVNPCGEEGLPPFGVCNLGSINLSALVTGDTPDTKGVFDFDRLKELVRIGVRFQDNIIDLDPYIFEGIRKMQLHGERRIGLGTMGLGDALIKLQLRYGLPEAIEFAEEVYRIIRDEAYRTSVGLSREKGAFEKFDAMKYTKGQFIQQMPDDLQADIAKYGVRNSLLLMQAPTGTTSLLSHTTSGIEPVYEFEFIRRDRLGKHVIRHHLYEAWYAKHKKEMDEGTIKRPEWFVSANDLTPAEHVKMQAVCQKYVDASISKTVNAPATHSVEDVKKLYDLAYKLGLKGITYMRDGSRPGVLERSDSDKKEEKKEVPLSSFPEVKPRPLVVSGSTYKVQTPVGKAFITVNSNGNGQPFEMFINVGKAGTDVAAMAEALGRMVSLNLRFNAHLSPAERVNEIVNQFVGIGGSRSVGFGKERVRSLPDAIAKVLMTHVRTGSAQPTNGVSNGVTNGHVEHVDQTDISEAPDDAAKQLQLEARESYDICPDCGVMALAYEEGCKKCYSCGYSEC